MLTRRQLLNTTLAGSAAFLAGASAAQAFTEQPMPPAMEAEYLAGCGGNNGGHDQLIQKARAVLLGEIAQGVKPAGAESVVACPICGCRMVVTAGN
ncbi:hypothetical protein [Dongia sp. agr-C8]